MLQCRELCVGVEPVGGDGGRRGDLGRDPDAAIPRCRLPDVPAVLRLRLVRAIATLRRRRSDATIANAVIAKLSPTGTTCIYTSATTHLIVDTNGYTT